MTDEIEAIRARVAEQKTKPAPWVYLKDAETLLQALDESREEAQRLSTQYQTELEAWSVEQERLRAEYEARIAELEERLSHSLYLGPAVEVLVQPS